MVNKKYRGLGGSAGYPKFRGGGGGKVKGSWGTHKGGGGGGGSPPRKGCGKATLLPLIMTVGTIAATVHVLL